MNDRPPSKPLTWKLWLTQPLAEWREWWFQPVPLMRLALVRIVFVACHLIFFFPSLARQQRLVSHNESFIDPQVLIAMIVAIVPESMFRTVEMITFIWIITLLAGVAALVGLFTRASLFVLAAGTATLVAHGFSYGVQHHPEALFTIALFVMAFSPCGAVLSVDAWRAARRRADGVPADLGAQQRRQMSSNALWPLLCIQCLLALAYLNAGVCKIYMGGLQWFDGYTMQMHLLQDAIRWDRPMGLWVAQQWWLALVISFFAVGFEVAFPLVLFWRRLVPWFLVMGLGMHIGIFALQAAPFWQFMVLYMAFLPVERVWDWARRGRGVMIQPTTSAG
ncbi:HTTM domain-containing protein [Phycisphaerales bacterium AB-hyl4]|uniref:HTTM domain-containing protein n=1 Tax=Natronomicrosphaera hydrolytica TaxID=3242702 RepID=A0ABV4U234_9BACT